MTYVRRIA